MTLRTRIRRWHSPTLFALVGLCFLLPFATVSCDNAKTTFTGAQLVTRTVPLGGMVHKPGYGCTTDLSRCVESQASTPATVALAAAILGLALGLLGITRGPGWCAATGLIALLVLAKPAFDFGGPDVGFHSGYELAFLLYLWASGLQVSRLRARLRAGRPAERGRQHLGHPGKDAVSRPTPPPAPYPEHRS